MDASPHVLVVDDHRDIREPLARYLERHGLRVTVAESAAAARWAHSLPPDRDPLPAGTYRFDRAVDNQVSRLHREIEHEPQNPALIVTLWGDGYRFTGEVERR